MGCRGPCALLVDFGFREFYVIFTFGVSVWLFGAAADFVALGIEGFGGLVLAQNKRVKGLRV